MEFPVLITDHTYFNDLTWNYSTPSPYQEHCKFLHIFFTWVVTNERETLSEDIKLVDISIESFNEFLNRVKGVLDMWYQPNKILPILDYVNKNDFVRRTMLVPHKTSVVITTAHKVHTTIKGAETILFSTVSNTKMFERCQTIFNRYRLPQSQIRRQSDLPFRILTPDKLIEYLKTNKFIPTELISKYKKGYPFIA